MPVPAQPTDEASGPAIEHRQGFPNFLSRLSPAEAALSADAGLEVALGGSAIAELENHRRLTAALGALAAQRPGTVDAYLLSVALDSDPVFGREAREAARVLARRYGGEGRTIVLAGPDGTSDDLPHGSLSALSIALAGIAERMDLREDVLLLFVTAHGQPTGLAYHYGDQGFGGMSPTRLGALLAELGIEKRMLIVNACFSGSFVPALGTPMSVVVSASAADRTSFGCAPANDWTYFGDAFVNRALRRPQGLRDAFDEARQLVGQWEANAELLPSEPRIAVGMAADSWLDPLEARVPETAMARTGRPAAVQEDQRTGSTDAQ
ncbi:MAG: C13 family peptidase [Parasphingopyxis sp.]